MRTILGFLAVTAGFALAQTPAPARAARAASVSGQVSIGRNGQPWAVSAGDWVPPQQVISTGSDGYASFRVAGGSSFEIFNNSRVVFRQNTTESGDLLDVIDGRVRVHLQPSATQLQQRIFCPVASIIARERATIALAVDEDDDVRIDVIEGSVRVQHAFFPQKEPVLVTAVDAILVERDERISRRLDRGSLYRFTVRSIKDVWSAITFGHTGSRDGEAQFSSDRLLAKASSFCIQLSGP
ncbi:MAG: FecR domain-containing protein [Acidobacteriaceae bacterium]|nr:FecR domain-containing protein [Acidobacteriaceae bacterium]MBV9779341.1 FecR domain-containing protein [Acidobacteriaceae bacterium]